MRADDLGLGFYREISKQYSALQPQIENYYNIGSQLVDSLGGLNQWSNELNLSYLSMENNYSQLLSQVQGGLRAELPGIVTAVEELHSITAELGKRISYSGIEKILDSFQTSMLGKYSYESLSDTIAGLSRIFDDDFKRQLEYALDSFNSLSAENPHPIDNIWESIAEEDLANCSIDSQGTITCDGNVITAEEAQRTILDAILNLIKKVNNSRIEFEKQHKVIVFLFKMYLGVCTVFGKSPAEPFINTTQKVISTTNDYDDKYFVSEECVRVYTDPTSRSQVIYRVSYGETVISEENARGWIKVSIAADDKVYQGWIAKRNLISYEKAKFDSEEVEHEVE